MTLKSVFAWKGKTMVTKGYHGTSIAYKKDIEEKGLDPKKTKINEDHWLGQGVYFFADCNLAKWWAPYFADKEKKGVVIFESEIIAEEDKVFDLDLAENVDKFYTFALNLLKQGVGSGFTLTKKQYRAVLFDMYKEKYNIDVIIRTFDKDREKYSKNRTRVERIKIKTIADLTDIKFHEKQICVSRKECIQNTRVVYDKKEEV